MKNAKELLLAYLAADAGGAAALFADGGSLELPYLADIGIDPKYRGPKDIANFLEFLHAKIYPGFAFEDVTIHFDTAEHAFGEYHINAKSGISGKTVHQQFFGHLTAEKGKIKSLVEAVNLIAAAEAIFPGGIAEVVRKSSPR